MGEQQKYVWLNNIHYPIDGPVQWDKITPFPQQLMVSAPGVADYTPTSKQAWGKLKGGMGIEKWTAEDNDRYAEADGVDASINMQSLAPLVTTMGTFGAEPVKIIKFEGRIWAIGHNQISYWTGSAWTSVKTDFPNPTDAACYYGVTP
jgi:hypothetical protein